MNTIPLVLAWVPMPLWLIPILLIIGVILFLAGRNNIRTQRMSLSWKQQRLWGISELTGQKAVVGGYIRCGAGICMVIVAILGPFVTRALSKWERIRVAQRNQQIDQELDQAGREFENRRAAMQNDLEGKMEQSIKDFDAMARRVEQGFDAILPKFENPSAQGNTTSQAAEPGFIDDPTRWRAE